MTKYTTLFVALVMGLIVSVAPASVVTYSMQLDESGPGTWSVYASVSDDCAGLAYYKVTVDGATTIKNEGPMLTVWDGTKAKTYGFGVGLVRSGDDVNPVVGSLETIGADINEVIGNLTYGFGQDAGDLTDMVQLGENILGVAVGTNPYASNLLLASGTYSGSVNLDITHSAASVLTDLGSANVEIANVVLVPAPPALAVLPLLALLAFRKRQRRQA